MENSSKDNINLYENNNKKLFNSTKSVQRKKEQLKEQLFQKSTIFMQKKKHYVTSTWRSEQKKI
jgi:hypothetical protein